MSDSETKPRSTLAVWLIVACVLPVAYVLAIGPVIWIRECGYLQPATCELIELPFYPLAWLRDYFGPARVALDWYLDLWR
jgi:hypothetical protein